MSTFEAGLDGVTFRSHGSKLLGGFYRAAGETPRPTAILLHGIPGVEKHLDIAYRLRDRGWNCLYFHYRGCWGSEGAYSLHHLTVDAHAALEWAVAQPSVDRTRLALVGGSMGGYTALLYGAGASHVAAVAALCPLIDPATFHLTSGMAGEFANMLTGVTGETLGAEWGQLAPVTGVLAPLASKRVLLVTGDRDELFPLAHYEHFAASLPAMTWARAADGDHAFSTCRPWLVETVTDWLVRELGV